MPATNPNRGVPPSSLQAQAERLALGGPQGRPTAVPISAPAAAAPVAVAATPSRLEIQVGAFQTSAEAERQVTLVRAKAASLLQGRSPLVVPVQKENRQLYRARFAGFEAKSAAAACLELRRLAVDCFVMRSE